MAEFKVSCQINVLAMTPSISKICMNCSHFLLNLSLPPHQTALSPVIYDTLTSLMTSLISIEMEKTVLKCSFSRVRSRALPQGGTGHPLHHFASRHWHMWWKASSNDLLMSLERPAGEGASSLCTIASFYFELRVYRKPLNVFLYFVQHVVLSLLLMSFVAAWRAAVRQRASVSCGVPHHCDNLDHQG